MQPVEDETFTFYGGQDDYQNPDRIKPECYSKGINVVTKRSVLGPRPGFVRKELKFQDTSIITSKGYTRSIEELFKTGKFQAAMPFIAAPENYIIIVISGFIYRYNINTDNLVLLSETITVNQFSARINWTVAGRFLVLFDYPDSPVIIDDRSEVTRASEDFIVNGLNQPQVPPSTVGTFNQTRLFVADAGVSFTGGDPVGSQITPDAPVTFAEVLLPATPYTGQSFSLGTNNNDEAITAMGFLQAIDVSTGIGPLFVATKNSIYSYRTDLPRSEWELTAFGSLLLYNAGIIGPRAFINVNSDLVFLSEDGAIYALSTSRNDFKRWGSVPISREVENWLKTNNKDLLTYSFLGYFNNYIMVACNPFRTTALTRDAEPISDYAFAGMSVLSLDNISTLSQESNPVWEGLWTGINPMEIIHINGRCFFISKDSSTINHLYELDTNINHDVIEGRERRVRSIIYTREYDFKSKNLSKELQSADVSIQKVKGNLDLKIEYRPNNVESFALWRNWKYNAPDVQCGVPEYPNGLASHSFKEMNLGSPEEEKCDPVYKDVYSNFKRIQLRITVEAKCWEIERINLFASMSPDSNNISSEVLCDFDQGIAISKECTPDWLVPVLSNCEKYNGKTNK